MNPLSFVKTPLLKTLTLSALFALSFGAGLAQADNGSCLLGLSNTPIQTMEARLNQRMELIEQGLRMGQISPLQAGKMMREQWELMQFQRGFLEGSRDAGGHNASCTLGQGIDAKQVAARMVPVVSGLAVEGVQTATMVMRALAKEAGKLLREDAPISSPVDAWY